MKVGSCRKIDFDKRKDALRGTGFLESRPSSLSRVDCRSETCHSLETINKMEAFQAGDQQESLNSIFIKVDSYSTINTNNCHQLSRI